MGNSFLWDLIVPLLLWLFLWGLIGPLVPWLFLVVVLSLIDSNL